ncbi:MAG: MATE family efflux transporter [Ruminococcaceae bacterium]|nr:MATE family efflux transporter [Oscillospiraceae bacterium]
MKTSNDNILSGPITKTLILMTFPVILMNVTQSLYGLVDMAILKSYYNDTIVGAVGTSGILMVLCSNMLTGVAAGASVVVAKHLGAKNNHAANRASMTSLVFTTISSILFLIVGVIFAEKFLMMTNCPETILPYATKYFKLYFIGVPLTAIASTLLSVIRATGDTKTPFYFSLISGGVKIIALYIFTAFFDMNVIGAGLSSIIANFSTSVLSLVVLMKKDSMIKLDFSHIVFDMKEFKSMLYIGIPTGLQTSLYSFANVVISSAVNTFGADATTGVSIANQFDGIMYQIIHAPSLAVIPFVSQNVGAKNFDRVKKAFLSSTLITIVIGAGLGTLSAIFSGELSATMTKSPEVIAYSMQKMVIISSTYFICGINEVLSGVLRGIGKPIPPTVCTLIYMCLLRLLWVYAIFPLFPNLTFLYTVWPLGWVLSIITLLFIYFPTIKRLQNQKSY